MSDTSPPVIRRLVLPVARLALVTATVLTTGGCCRCWWPGSIASDSAATAPTGGEDLDGGEAARSAPGEAKEASIALSAFAPDPREPLHGAIMIVPSVDPFHRDEAQSKYVRFVSHSATSAAAMFNGDVVVEANTGIWSHAAGTLARGARIIAVPVLAMAASPDGRYLAYARGSQGASVADIHVLSYPDGKVVASFYGVDRPRRLRFSPDGKRLVVASRSAETVTLADIASKSVRRYDTDDDVNDAIALPGEGDLVAYANDGDEAVIHSMASHEKLFSTNPFMREVKGVALTPITGSRARVLTMLRDQNAVAFDPLGGVFFAGGDDNVVWRFHGATGRSPRMDPPVELSGNIEEILCTHKPAPGQTEASVVVALDTLAISVLTPDGKVQASVGPINWSVQSSPIRIALTPDDEVLAVVNGALALFNPESASVRPTREYPNLSSSWRFSSTERDTVIAAGGDPIILHHVLHTAETADTTTTVVGTIALSNAGIEAFASGTRLLFGASSKGRIPLIYYVPSSGAIEPPLDIAAAPLARVALRKDGTAIGLLDSEGRLFEVTETPRGGSLVGRARGALQPTDFLAWDEVGNRWQITDMTGKATAIEPP